ncbi:TonB-dependent receptor plug domain-containing protein [Fulvivirgaceae bacterium LMO-SS25]
MALIKYLTLSILSVVFALNVVAQSPQQKVELQGIIKSEGKVLGDVWVQAQNAKGVFSDNKGAFSITVDKLPIQLNFNKIGYLPLSLIIEKNRTIEIELLASDLSLSEVVISGSRREQDRMESPIGVQLINRDALRFSNSNDLAEGLRFKPGLRIENNCSNCGFTQLRLNGLDGPYTQILINSRPVFSALAGVYGLEQINPEMIENVEIVRGGGSALFGANAIAGTVNIITRKPSRNMLEIASQLSVMPDGATEQNYNFTSSLISNKNNKSGAFLFASYRNREAWDKDRDGYSELPQIETLNLGTQGFWKAQKGWDIDWSTLLINESRRGGSHLNLPPQKADLAEQLDHKIIGGSILVSKFFADQHFKLSTFTAWQYVDRASYYGSGGNENVLRKEGLSEIEIAESIADADNFFGNTYDLSGQIGVQGLYDKGKNSLITGLEWQLNKVNDRMPGYERRINQQINGAAAFSQWEYRITPKLTSVIGGRLDYLQIDGGYDLGASSLETEQNIWTFNPRANMAYKPDEDQIWRVGYGRGFRPPQAFDEDLHIELVGGEALFIRLSEDLTPEYSQSLNFSYDRAKERHSWNAELFYTELQHPFINVLVEENGRNILQKENADVNGKVFGLNTELNVLLNSQFTLQGGFTLQGANYSKAILVADEVGLFTDKFLRTPNTYGFFTTIWRPSTLHNIRTSLNYTGPMDVLYQGIQREISIDRTKSFLEWDIFMTRSIPIHNQLYMELSAGVRNILNAYQSDFESGRERDASYIYGPIRPRTISFGLKVGF